MKPVQFSGEVVVHPGEVSTRTFVKYATPHVDGLAGYVRDFLKKFEGCVNEVGRPWTVELCAELLKLHAPSLRRWIARLDRADQQVSAPLATSTAQTARKSHAKKALQDPGTRKEVLEALDPDTRDAVRAEVQAIAVDQVPRVDQTLLIEQMIATIADCTDALDLVTTRPDNVSERWITDLADIMRRLGSFAKLLSPDFFERLGIDPHEARLRRVK